MTQTKPLPETLPKPLPTPEAAAFLGVGEHSLKVSRQNGKLGGLPAPPFRKLGKLITYDLKSLTAWRDEHSPLTAPGGE